MLSDVMRLLEKENKLHPALAKAYDKLYAYTSDANGIRH